MEGFLEIFNSIYLCSSGKNFWENFSNYNIFLFKGRLSQHTLKGLNPSIGTALLSFSLLKFEFSFSYFLRGLLQQHTQMEEILPLKQPSLFLNCIFCKNVRGLKDERRF